MAIQNPWYIDANARHYATQQRLLAYNAMEGQEGILGDSHLRVTQLDTPGTDIRVMPGAFSVLARHLGGAYEAYVGKILEAEQVQVTPTPSSGGRTDLVILRIENPYVLGSGSWAEPNDPAEGPYAFIRVVEGVPANTNHISAHNNTWSAITLARITRPANTGVILQSHIADLRSIAKLGEQRIIVIENPPAEPPPIAQTYWTESTPCEDSAVIAANQFAWTNFPLDASWQVPVPSWATGFDVNGLINPQIDEDVWGQARIVINNGSIQNDACGIIPAEYDFNYHGGPGPERNVFMIGGTGSLQTAHRGKIVNMRLQVRSITNDWQSAHKGKLYQQRGTRANIWINFKRNPSYDP